MIKLRGFSLSDLEQIMEIEKSSFPNREVFPKFLFKKYYKQYPEGFIVAEINGEIVGYTIGQPRNESAEIISLAVAPPWRQKGIGEKLTNFLVNHFRGKNIKEIFLHVRTKNKTAISFYQEIGFEILKTIKNYYWNGDDAFLMEKELGE